ncbi:MAG: SdrD B-like domain-containing protein [Saprospiraceae bacterium]
MRQLLSWSMILSLAIGLALETEEIEYHILKENEIEIMPTININRVDVSSCYFYNDKSYATVSVEFSWENAPPGDSLLVQVPGEYSTFAYIDLPIFDEKNIFLKTIPLSSPQVIAFELPANKLTKTVQINFNSEPSPKASSSFALPGECPFLFCGEDTTRLSGLAFLDLNADGIRQFGETTGYADMVVHVFECFKLDNQEPLKSTTTNANGEYSFLGLETGNEYKVIFEFPEGATLVNTSGPGEINEMVQFATVPNCGINVSVSDRGLYCERNPAVAMACFVHGDPIPGSQNDTEILLSIPYDTKNADNSEKKIIAKVSEAGSIWGIAWDAGNQALYTSSVLRRHSAMGPLGLGGIYRKEENKPFEQWLDLTFGGTFNFGKIPNNFDRGLAILPEKPSIDSTVFPLFGKVGIGGIDIDPFGEYIFVCNLFDKHIYQITKDADDDPATKPTISDVVRLPIPSICDPALGNSRPWAVKVFDNHLYVGVVCDAEFSQNRSDMRGYIFIYSLLDKKWLDQPAIDFPLTYPKGAPATHVFPFQECGLWNPWNEDYTTWCRSDVSDRGTTFYYSYPMPLISDLEFDVDGTLVIAMIDRSAFMTGNEDFDPSGSAYMKSISAAGDILRALKFKNVYILENNGISGPHKGLLSGNRQGPGFGEFFSDNYHVPDSTLIHAELALGATALLPASKQMIFNAVDPISYSNFKFAAGLRWQSTVDGDYLKGYVAYTKPVLPSFSKSAGLGDIELQCEKLTDVTIGNYVWVDYDRDGIQDPCEPPAEGINVTLFEKDGTEIATIQTDSIGRYFFRSSDLPQIKPETDYDIVFATYGQYDRDLRVTLSGIGKVLPTLPNREYSSYGDRMDSDATITHFPRDHFYFSYPAMGVRTPSEGSIDLSFDFGLSFYDYAVKNIIINEKLLPYINGEEIIYQIVVYNFGGLPGFDIEVSAYMNGGMIFNAPESNNQLKTQNKLQKSIAVNEGWTLSGDTLLYAYIDTLLEAASDTLSLTLIVTNAYGPESWNLMTEVSDALNILGESTAEIDLDGILDRNKNNNGGNLYRSLADNWLLGDGTATQTNGNPDTDQDNADPAIANILDVALKIYPDPKYQNNYDSIKYIIVIENQGSFDLDSTIVSLYYSDSYCFDENVNGNWSLDDQPNIVYTSLGALTTLEKDTVCIYLKAISGKSIEDWTVEAEISKAYGLGGMPLVGFDIDSKLNSDFTDNVGGIVDSPADDYLLGLGNASGSDTVAISDQDNADRAYILPTDMALRLTIDSEFTNVSVSFGDTVKYIIEIFNQGKDTITNVSVIDYKQPCLIFDPSLNTDFIEIDEGFITTYNGILYPLQSSRIPIYLIIKPGDECEYINEAEILRFYDVNGKDLSNFDLDSSPDTIFSNDPVIIDELGRILLDSLDPCNNFLIILDEDDHDISPIPKYDLALKNVVLTFPQKYGDTVCYQITVYNQGNKPVKSIDVINHFSEGLLFDEDLNEGWRPIENAAIYTHDPLLFGEDSIKIDLKAIILPASPDSFAHLSIAEILSMYNSSGQLMNDSDLDSNPDAILDNDVGGIPLTLSDDHILDDRLDTNNDNIIDEDDHDPALITALDLSIQKRVTNPKVFSIGDKVEYQITIKNEGSETASGFSIVDYLPIGLSFVQSSNLLWSLDAQGRPVHNSKKVLKSGDSTIVDITLIVNRDTQLLLSSQIVNVVEIFNHLNSLFLVSSDFDSDPDKDKSNDMTLDTLTGEMHTEDDTHFASIIIDKVDPRGVIYCDATGEIVKGGKITITRLQNGEIIEPVFSLDTNLDTLDGRTGFYQFAIPTALILDNIDTFRISYTHSLNIPLSTSCLPAFPVFNADGIGTNGMVTLGDTTFTNGLLDSFSCAMNPYFTDFILTDTTPLILGNNLPLMCGALGGIVCADQDTNATFDNNETRLSGRLVLLYLCADTTVVIDTSMTDGQGEWIFNGLTDSCYRVQVIQDQNLVNYPNTNFAANGWSRPFNVAAGARTLNNNFCFPILDCDSIYCQSSLNITVPDGCDYKLEANIMLRGIIPRRDFIEFSYFDDNNVEIKTDIIPKELIGKCIEVVSTTVLTCPFSPCLTRICFESKNAPIIDCPIDTILCTMAPNFMQAVVNEDCFEGTIDIINETSVDLCQNDSIIMKLSRTYQGTDQFGNLTNTCNSDLYVKAVDIHEIIFPADTAVSCDFSFDNIKSMNFGLPTFQGIEIKEGLTNRCGLHVAFEDQLLQDLQCKKVIKRMWTIYQNGCGKSAKRQLPQTIIITDKKGPTISVQSPLILNTQQLECNAIVTIPLDQIVDMCSDVTRLIANSPFGTADYLNGEVLKLPPGTHQVTLQAFDLCHNITNDTITVIVTDNVAPVSICLLNEVVVIGELDSTVTIPINSIKIDQYDNCAVAEVKGRKMNITCGPQDTVFGDMITICCNDVDTDLMILIRATDTNGNQSTCMSILKVELNPKNVSCLLSASNPIVDDNKNNILFGNVINRLSDPMEDVQIVMAEGLSMESKTTTKSDGSYEIKLNKWADTSKVTPYDNNNWHEGLSTMDAIHLKRHLIGTVELTGYDLKAADINGDGNISVIDIILLRRIILGIDQSVLTNTSWTFDQANTTLNLENEMHMQWVGIKTGDLLGSTHKNAIELHTSPRSAMPIFYRMKRISDKTWVDFYIKESLQILGLQGVIQLPMQCKVDDIVSGQISLRPEQFLFDDKSHQLRLSHNSTQPTKLGSELPLFSLLLHGNFETHVDKITMKSSFLTPEIYLENSTNGFYLRPDLVSTYRLKIHHNDPNPWSEETNIIFQLPDRGTAKLSIHDIDGKLLFMAEKEFEKGLNQYRIDKKMISATGVLIYKLEFGEDTVTGKMIRIK